MGSSEALQIAQEIKRQLIEGDLMRFYSWGAKGFSYDDRIEEAGEVSLLFQVNGAIFKGKVRVTLVMGADHYRVELFRPLTDEAEKSFEPVYCDNLAELIDGEVEKPSHITRKGEYMDFLRQSAA